MMIPQAMVLAAGMGKRLRPLTNSLPKPLIPVGGVTMLDYALDQLDASGISFCVINTHYLADKIRDHISKRTRPHIIISHEPELLDTGGGIAKALPYFKDNPFFVLNADTWWRDQEDSILQHMMERWDETKMDALLLLVPREKAIGYIGRGDYFLTKDGCVSYRRDEEIAPTIFSGIRILHPRILKGEKIRPFSIIPLFHKIEKEGRLYGMIYKGQWGDVGTPESLEKVQNEVRRLSL